MWYSREERICVLLKRATTCNVVSILQHISPISFITYYSGRPLYSKKIHYVVDPCLYLLLSMKSRSAETIRTEATVLATSLKTVKLVMALWKDKDYIGKALLEAVLDAAPKWRVVLYKELVLQYNHPLFKAIVVGTVTTIAPK